MAERRRPYSDVPLFYSLFERALSTRTGGALYWRWKWKSFSPKARPEPLPHNATLRTRAEWQAAVAQLEQLGLPVYDCLEKNWDSLAALDCILARTKPDDRVLDAGSVFNAVILPWLALYGYQNLFGNNLAMRRRVKIGPITYDHGDITKTGYADGTFAAITCLSVIEHGVPVEAYLREMARILRPGGVLITSTDYWQEGMDTSGKIAFGVPVRVFDQPQIEQLLATARTFGLYPTSDIDLRCEERAVHWPRQRLDFTFVLLTLEKR